MRITYLDVNKKDEFTTKIYIGWDEGPFLSKIKGWGELVFTWDKNKIKLDAECLNKESVKEILNVLVDQAELIG
jgi:hypothetical protein